MKKFILGWSIILLFVATIPAAFIYRFGVAKGCGLFLLMVLLAAILLWAIEMIFAGPDTEIPKDSIDNQTNEELKEIAQ